MGISTTHPALVAAAAGCDRLGPRSGAAGVKPRIAVFLSDRVFRFCGDCVADRSLRQRLQVAGQFYGWPWPTKRIATPAPHSL
ncbi:hypothetical protein EMIT0P201_60346 [Pseudomonas chlororaphis]